MLVLIHFDVRFSSLTLSAVIDFHINVETN
jgi:hypothetical protein